MGAKRRESDLNRALKASKQALDPVFLNKRYLVLHPGSAREQRKERVIKTLKESFNWIFDKIKFESVKILIEIMAGQGNSSGSSFRELAEILFALKKDNLFGICFDSTHFFEAGYDIGEGGYERS